MCGNRELVELVTLWKNTESQHCDNDNNDNDDNVMCVSVWFEFFGGLMSKPVIYVVEGTCPNKEGDLI
jgi:hypothetical protein